MKFLATLTTSMLLFSISSDMLHAQQHYRSPTQSSDLWNNPSSLDQGYNQQAQSQQRQYQQSQFEQQQLQQRQQLQQQQAQQAQIPQSQMHRYRPAPYQYQAPQQSGSGQNVSYQLSQDPVGLTAYQRQSPINNQSYETSPSDMPMTLNGSGNEITYDSVLDSSCGYQTGCNTSCCPPCGVVFGVESTFFRYNRSDGTRYGTSGTQEVVSFNYNYSPRITLGYACKCGPGFRMRWFNYNNFVAGGAAGQGLGVNTTIWDFEVFRPYQVSSDWAVELSAGFRIADFRETMQDGAGGSEVRVNDVEAFGFITGIESRHRLGYGSVYGRVRYGILTGDKYVRNDNTPVAITLNDSIFAMTELAMGYQWQHRIGGCYTGVVRIGAEWQHWENFSSAFVNTAPGGEDFSGPSDVGFVGLTLEAGIYF